MILLGSNEIFAYRGYSQKDYAEMGNADLAGLERDLRAEIASLPKLKKNEELRKELQADLALINEELGKRLLFHNF